MKHIKPSPKRIPRKIKKHIIKIWGRETYKGIMNGTIWLMCTPPVKWGEPIISEPSDFKPRVGIKSRYALKQVDNKAYHTIKVENK